MWRLGILPVAPAQGASLNNRCKWGNKCGNTFNRRSDFQLPGAAPTRFHGLNCVTFYSLIFNLAAKPASVTEFCWSLTPVPNGKLESAATACHRTSAVDFAQGGGISMAGKLI
jgi:hypothetical protein